jgi:hypothetical protein
LVRSTPYVTGGNQITTLADGDAVTASGRTEDGQWIRITLDNGRSAWVARFLLTAAESFDTLDTVGPRSAIYAPMQAFYMESGANDAACPEAPNSGLMIQTPEGVAEITFLINEVDIQLGSTVFFQANAGQEMTISVIEGSASVTAEGVTRKAITGSQISVPLDENGAASAIPSMPRPYDWGYVMALPTTYMDEPVPVDPGQPPPPPPPPPPGDDNEKVVICFNGKTQTVSVNALQSFLDRGATIGACQ